MSEQENINLVKKMYEHFTKGDVQNLLNSFTDNAEVVEPPQGPPPFAGTYKGKTQINTFFKNLSEAANPISFEGKEYIAKENTVVALGHYRFHSKVTHNNWDTDLAMVLRIDNNKVSMLEMYKDSAAELKALEKELVHA